MHFETCWLTTEHDGAMKKGLDPALIQMQNNNTFSKINKEACFGCIYLLALLPHLTLPIHSQPSNGKGQISPPVLSVQTITKNLF